MQAHTHDLLREIDAFIGRTGMGEAYFGKLACRNSELVRRLRSGGRVWPETAKAVREFIASYPSAKSEGFLPVNKDMPSGAIVQEAGAGE